ncbi:Cytochrome P450 [Penicillium coprophilum]|uniref:Cytochrome P450 n=1 Tax=Penicillium coprophilum TaxID=36646 RepID=UPI00238EC103|nr:Cytochrome P450 [Penicillium coprophilum]KAJ5154502.1 Cytochrome P450 [Penicillium coprophilum]
MDPFSLTAGAVGITAFALSSISNLRKLLDGLEEASNVLQDVRSNLEAIQRPLSALTDLQISDSKTHAETRKVLEETGVAEAVNNCGQACAEFTKKLEKWTKHSSAPKLSLRDRLSVGLWNKEKLQTFKTQVATCQAIVQLAIDSAQLVILVRSENASKAARQETEKRLRIIEIDIKEQIQLTKNTQDETLQRKKELDSFVDEDEEEDEDGGAQRALAIQEVEKRSRVLEANQIAYMAVSQILSRLSVAQVGDTYHIDFSGSTNHGLQVGHSTGTLNWNSSRN